MSFSLTTSGGIFVEGRKFRKWLGVNGSLSPGHEEFDVSGLVFAIRSASVNTVLRTSSFIGSLPRIAFKLLFTVRTSLSHTPDIWDAPGVVKHPLATALHEIIFQFPVIHSVE